MITLTIKLNNDNFNDKVRVKSCFLSIEEK